MNTKEMIYGNLYIQEQVPTSLQRMKLLSTKNAINKMITHNDLNFAELFAVCLVKSEPDDDRNWYTDGITGYDELIGWKQSIRFIPLSVLEGHSFGDIVTMKILVKKHDPENDITSETFVKVSLKICQKNFQEVLQHVKQLEEREKQLENNC